MTTRSIWTFESGRGGCGSELTRKKNYYPPRTPMRSDPQPHTPVPTH